MRSQTKVVLRCTGEEELLVLEARAQSLKLCARSIQDASVVSMVTIFLGSLLLSGRTQIAAGSRTVLGILGSARMDCYEY